MTAATTTSTGVRERPILFSSQMVREILDGRKTMTRRVMKPQPPGPFDGDDWTPEYYGMLQPMKNGEPEEPSERDRWGVYGEHMEWGAFSPYGGPGDRLWVRETTMPIGEHPDPGSYALAAGVFYAADYFDHERRDIARDAHQKWRPSIHMPRRASRITLEVVSVRVERLQDISFADCRAEGCSEAYFEQVDPCSRCDGNDPCTGKHTGEKWHFSRLWDSINAKRGFAWKDNPWVWVIEFRNVQG